MNIMYGEHYYNDLTATSAKFQRASKRPRTLHSQRARKTCVYIRKPVINNRGSIYLQATNNLRGAFLTANLFLRKVSNRHALFFSIRIYFITISRLKFAKF